MKLKIGGKDFQTFKNETVKLLSGTQSRAEEGPFIPSILFFQGALVPLKNMCHQVITNRSHSNQQLLPGNTSLLFQKPRYQQARPSNQLSKAKWCPEDSNNPDDHILTINNPAPQGTYISLSVRPKSSTHLQKSLSQKNKVHTTSQDSLVFWDIYSKS